MRRRRTCLAPRRIRDEITRTCVVGLSALALASSFPSTARAQDAKSIDGGAPNVSGNASSSLSTSVPSTDIASPNGGPTNIANAGANPTATTKTTVPSAGTPERPEAPKEESALPPSSGRFEFGSYGRVNVASDLRGGTGRNADIVAFGSRLDEDSYAELEFRREDKFDHGIATRIVTTVALLPPFFHFSGNPVNDIAVRQLYAQGTMDGWSLWGGVRMVRGDDVYLFNFWPLDNQNTVGGGVGKTFEKTDTHVALHVGMQRLDNPYQYQQIPSAIPYGNGATNITYLDRPRTIETLKVTQLIRNNDQHTFFHGKGMEKAGFKVIAYGEAQQISAGVRRDTDTDQDISLPSDTGWVVGSQLTFFTGERDNYLSLVMRHARGLAAYDPLATPDTFANDRTTSGASETRAVLSGNFESGNFGLLGAGYLRWFRDGSSATTSLSRYDEGNVALRPQWFATEHFGVAVEGSYQQRRYAILNADGSGPLTASLLRGAVLPYFSPAGRGSFKRPILGLIYMATSRDAGARSLYPQGDVFNQRRLEHYAGLTVEWWFNSSSYP